MKHTTTVLELTGTNESPVGGNFITSSNRDFVTRRVVVGISTLYNMSSGKSALVSGVTASRIDSSIAFAPGDFFKVTLTTPWTIQTSDGPVIEVECNRCGFSYPRKELSGGLCKTCIDEERNKAPFTGSSFGRVFGD